MELIRKIEELRLELNKLAVHKLLTDREIIIISQELDKQGTVTAISDVKRLRL